MKKILITTIILLCATLAKADDVVDTNSYDFTKYYADFYSHHLKLDERNYLILGIGYMNIGEQSIKTDYLTLKLHINNNKATISEPNSIKTIFNVFYNRDIKLSMNNNNELDIISAIPIRSEPYFGILFNTIPIKETIKDGKLISTICDSSFQNVISTKHTAPLIYNNDESVSLHFFGSNKNKDSTGIFILNYDKEMKFKDYQYIPQPTSEKFKTLSGLNFIDTSIYFKISDVFKSDKGTLYQYQFKYNYKHTDGKIYSPTIVGVMFYDNNNKLVYIKTPTNLIPNQENIITNIMQYDDKIIIGTYDIKDTNILGNSYLQFMDIPTGKITKSEAIGWISKDVVVQNMRKLINGSFIALSKVKFEGKDKALLSYYDKNLGTILNEFNPRYADSTMNISPMNFIEISDSTYYIYGTNNFQFYGLLYTIKKSSVEISASDNTTLKVQGEINHLKIVSESKDNIPAETNIEIYDISGRRIHSGKYDLISGQPLDIFTPALINGAYIIKLSNQYFTLSQKIVI